MAKKESIGAHGFTERMREEIKMRTMSNDVEMIAGNMASKLQDKEFKNDFADYKLPMHERLHYHVAMEVRLYSQVNGSRQSVPSIQIFDATSWKTMSESDVFKSYTAEIVHNPELEEKNAKLVTFEYTLTEEEKENNSVFELTAELIEAADIAGAKELYKKTTGKDVAKSWSLEIIKQKLTELL